MKNSPKARRWAVDSIEEGIARLEEEGERMLSLPTWMLPSGVKEGEVLAVTVASAAGSLTLTITRDVESTAAALDASRAQTSRMMAESKKRDAGGDVAL